MNSIYNFINDSVLGPPPASPPSSPSSPQDGVSLVATDSLKEQSDVAEAFDDAALGHSVSKEEETEPSEVEESEEEEEDVHDAIEGEDSEWEAAGIDPAKTKSTSSTQGEQPSQLGSDHLNTHGASETSLPNNLPIPAPRLEKNLSLQKKELPGTKEISSKWQAGKIDRQMKRSTLSLGSHRESKSPQPPAPASAPKSEERQHLENELLKLQLEKVHVDRKATTALVKTIAWSVLGVASAAVVLGGMFAVVAFPPAAIVAIPSVMVLGLIFGVPLMFAGVGGAMVNLSMKALEARDEFLKESGALEMKIHMAGQKLEESKKNETKDSDDLKAARELLAQSEPKEGKAYEFKKFVNNENKKIETLSGAELLALYRKFESQKADESKKAEAKKRAEEAEEKKEALRKEDLKEDLKSANLLLAESDKEEINGKDGHYRVLFQEFFRRDEKSKETDVGKVNDFREFNSRLISKYKEHKDVSGEVTLEMAKNELSNEKFREEFKKTLTIKMEEK